MFRNFSLAAVAAIALGTAALAPTSASAWGHGGWHGGGWHHGCMRWVGLAWCRCRRRHLDRCKRGSCPWVSAA